MTKSLLHEHSVDEIVPELRAAELLKTLKAASVRVPPSSASSVQVTGDNREDGLA